MKNKRPSIKQLAFEAKIDSDEALIRLWDAGFERLTVTSERISGQDLIRAKQILGVATSRELTTLQYWQLHFGLEDKEFRMLLTHLSIPLNQKARKLPKGAVAKLKSESRKRASPENMDMNNRDGSILKTRDSPLRKLRYSFGGDSPL